MKGSEFRVVYREALARRARGQRTQRGKPQPKRADEDPFDARVRAMTRRFRGT